MKKVFLMAIIAASMMFVSCSNSPEAKAKSYLKEMIAAAEKGDKDKIEKISEEADAWEASLSAEDKAKLEEWQNSDEAKELAVEVFTAAMKAAANGDLDISDL